MREDLLFADEISDWYEANKDTFFAEDRRMIDELYKMFSDHVDRTVGSLADMYLFYRADDCGEQFFGLVDSCFGADYYDLLEDRVEKEMRPDNVLRFPSMDDS